MLRDAAYDQALSSGYELYKNSCITTETILLNNLYEIYYLEYRAGDVSFFDHKHSYRELVDAYSRVKFMLRRLGNNLISPESAVKYFADNHISKAALYVIAGHSLLLSETLLVKDFIK